MTRWELLDAEDDPALFPPVARATEQLRNLLILQEYWRSLSTFFKTNHEMILVSSLNSQRFIIRAKSFSNGVFEGLVEIDLHRRSGETSLLIPDSTRLEVEQAEDGRVTSLTLFMKNVRVGVGEIGENTREDLQVQALSIDADIAMPVMSDDIPALLAQATEVENRVVLRSANRLLVQLKNLHEQVVSRINQRWATVVAVILVFAGGQIVRDDRMIFGFFIMWSGNAGILALIFMSWKKLRIH
jgi:hypothetical protein